MAPITSQPSAPNPPPAASTCGHPPLSLSVTRPELVAGVVPRTSCNPTWCTRFRSCRRQNWTLQHGALQRALGCAGTTLRTCGVGSGTLVAVVVLAWSVWLECLTPSCAGFRGSARGWSRWNDLLGFRCPNAWRGILRYIGLFVASPRGRGNPGG